MEHQSTQLSADEAAVLAAGGTLEKGGGSGAMPENQKGAEGGLSAKAPGAPMKKGEGKTDDDEEKNKEGEEMDKGKTCKKSDVAEKDLIKAMDQLEAVANGIGGEPDRRADLASKLADGTLDKSERSELLSLIGGDMDDDGQGAEGENFQKSLSEAWAEGDNLGEDYDVSPFLEKLGTGIAKSIDSMREDLTKSMSSQQTFNRALAKSLRGMGQLVVEQADLIKSLQDQNEAMASRLGVVEQTPVGRKSRETAAQPLQKSFQDQGSTDGEVGMTRDDILSGLEQLMVKSRDNNWAAPCGEPVDRAMARYEATGAISRSMLNDVKNILGKAQ